MIFFLYPNPWNSVKVAILGSLIAFWYKNGVVTLGQKPLCSHLSIVPFIQSTWVTDLGVEPLMLTHHLVTDLRPYQDWLTRKHPTLFIWQRYRDCLIYETHRHKHRHIWAGNSYTWNIKIQKYILNLDMRIIGDSWI